MHTGDAYTAAVSQRPKTYVRRDLFGQCLREEGMVELVCSEVGDTATATSALAFLAAIARDHGAVNESLILFR